MSYLTAMKAAKTLHPDASIIEALGGATIVARAMEAPVSTVHTWRYTGIPKSRLAHIRLIAQAKGVSVDIDTLAQMAARRDEAPVA